jgi:hypothetical protein
MEQKYLISESLLKAIHDYLLSQPMRSVEGLVAALRNAEQQKSNELPSAG